MAIILPEIFIIFIHGNDLYVMALVFKVDFIYKPIGVEITRNYHVLPVARNIQPIHTSDDIQSSAIITRSNIVR